MLKFSSSESGLSLQWRALCNWESSLATRDWLRGLPVLEQAALGSESRASVTVPGRRCQPDSEWEPASEAAG
jgi:hypothetical protein